MAYRRKQPIARASTFTEDFRSSREESRPSISRFSTFKESSQSYNDATPPSSSSSSSLAAQALRESSAHRNSSLSSAYGDSAYREPNRQRFNSSLRQDSKPYEYTSINSLNETKDGFWGVLARKAKSILEDDTIAQKFEMPGGTRPQMLDSSPVGQSFQTAENSRTSGSPRLQKGLDAITSSLNYLGGTIGNALEEGLTKVESTTADIISETRKLHIRRKGSSADAQNLTPDSLSPHLLSPQIQTDQETQLKASRDVAMAMAAKAKLLLRELKTTKADLAFAKERCTQLEEENKILRESRDKGDTPEDDDLIRLQLETLLEEKARLASENSLFARENRFLREIVEYHQLTMQDVVYLDEGTEEVTEVCPIPVMPAADGWLKSPHPPSSPRQSISIASPATTAVEPVQSPKAPATPPSGSPKANCTSGSTDEEGKKWHHRSPTPAA